MTTLMQASNQWAKRPDDERFLSLTAMLAHFTKIKNESRATVLGSRTLEAIAADHTNLFVTKNEPGKERGPGAAPTNWAFNQLCKLADVPAGYVGELPAELAAVNLNHGLQFRRDIADVGLLLQRDEESKAVTLRAATGPQYGRIWNRDVVAALIEKFGDGVTGAFRVPGEFGKAVDVDKRNTTLYASDRDMFVFLADEEHRIEIPNRRNGEAGSLARGFFMWNSEVGKTTIGLGTFLFDFVCMNRIVWGAQDYKEIRIRHTAGAPERFLEEMRPAIAALSTAPTANIVQAITAARAASVADRLDAFLGKTLEKLGGKGLINPIKQIHDAEEGRPIESLWDVATAMTAYARGLKHQDKRVAIEKAAGAVIKLAA